MCRLYGTTLQQKETVEKGTNFIFLGSKTTAAGDCSHEIKRCLLLGRRAMTNLSSTLTSRDITLLTKVCIDEAPYVFDWENAIALDTMQGNRASSRREGKVSWVFSSCGRNLGYILELQRGCPFETLVCSLKSGTCLGMRDNSGM